MSQRADVIWAEVCRKCCMRYEFKLDNGATVTVLCGQPDIQSSYKAVSYVWGDTQPVPLQCRKCYSTKQIPLRDADKLWTILRLIGGGNAIWLDALSIDQNDPQDKAAQLPVMGHIYQHAQTVAVMLPVTDMEAYHLLKKLGFAADAIRKEYNAINTDSPSHIDPKSLKARTEQLTASFLTCLTDVATSLPRWKYWSRAWTFQEWSMASEIDISVEDSSHKETIVSIKNIIVIAASIAKIWDATISQLVGGQHTLLQRAAAASAFGPYLHTVKTIFAFRDFVVGGDECDPAETRLSSSLPIFPTATSTGTEMLVNVPPAEKDRLRCMVGIAVNAMRLTRREATNDADKVYCWASMCNIQFAYNKDDTYEEALHKVITSLRRAGVKIFNFSVTSDGAETDVNFLAYAGALRASNAADGGYFVGSSVFVGRTDTVLLCRTLLAQDPACIARLGSQFGVVLQRVERCVVRKPVLWSDKTDAVDMFRSMVSGKADGVKMLDIVPLVAQVLDKEPLEKLQKYYLMTVDIGVKDVHTMQYFQAWTICPANVHHGDLFVARESLNGTLGIAVSSQPKPLKEAKLLAYLFMTHQRDGTFLVQADENSVVDFVFRTPATPELDTDWMFQDLAAGNAALQESLVAYAALGTGEWSALDSLRDRVFNVEIGLEAGTLPVRI